jgi:hypothetical protein
MDLVFTGGHTFAINNLQWLLLLRPHDTFNQISKSKGHNSAKKHWTGTKNTKYQVNTSKNSEKKVVTTVLFWNYRMTDMGNFGQLAAVGL